MLELTVDAYPGRTFRGMIFVLDPQVNTEARTIKLQAGIDNSERLLMPGMFANVRIALPPREGVLTVAETALDHTIYGDSVYLVRSGDAGPDGKPTLTVVRTPVEAGERANGRVAVTGLKAGDRVVTAGQVKLFEGAAVTLDAQPVLKAPDQVPVE
jgi:multidrug efflux system membrane fusion protein